MAASTAEPTNVIQCAIKLALEQEVEKALARAKADLDKRIPELVAGLALHVAKNFSVQNLRDELIIHVRLDNREQTR